MTSSIAARIVPLATRTVRSQLRPQTCQRKAGSRRSFVSSRTLLEKKYTEDHEWVDLSPDGKIGTMGITEYASKQLGDVVYVELPEIGLEVKKGDTIGAVESVKSASDILTPVSGKVTDHNKMLEEKPGQVNQSPEGDAWLAKLEISDSGELENLMDKDAYKAFTEEAGDD